MVRALFRRPLLDIRNYWLGMYKTTSSPGDATYWAATRWYDGSTSTYRHWAAGYPRPDNYDTCVGYGVDGWIDQPCGVQYYFTCKKQPGT